MTASGVTLKTSLLSDLRQILKVRIEAVVSTVFFTQFTIKPFECPLVANHLGMVSG